MSAFDNSGTDAGCDLFEEIAVFGAVYLLDGEVFC
jgi:hypothetical protein